MKDIYIFMLLDENVARIGNREGSFNITYISEVSESNNIRENLRIHLSIFLIIA